jgi:SPP1 gp7 family putative phage head morphogenesis protein
MWHDAAASWIEAFIQQRMHIAKAAGKVLRRPVPGHVHMVLPLNIEAEYTEFIAGLLEKIAKAGAIPSENERADAVAPPGWERSMASMREAQRKIMEHGRGNIFAMVQRFGESTAAWNQKQWARQLKPYIGTDMYPPGDPLVKQTVEKWAKENVERITTLGKDQIASLDDVVQKAVQRGQTMTEVRKAIQAKNTEFTTWRAKLLARDQTGKLNGSLARTRSTSAGVSKYVWRGVLDQRERPAHISMEGSVRDWETGGIIPGEEILCRCTSEPALDEIWTKCETDVYGEQVTKSTAGSRPASVGYAATPAQAGRSKPAREPKPAGPSKEELAYQLLEKRNRLAEAYRKAGRAASETDALAAERKLAEMGVDPVPSGWSNRFSAEMAEAWDKDTPAWLMKANRRADQYLRSVENGVDRGYYLQGKKHIALSNDLNSLNDTWRHEFGHHLDAEMAASEGGAFFSQKLEGLLDKQLYEWSSESGSSWDISRSASVAKEIGVDPARFAHFLKENWGLSQNMQEAYRALFDGCPKGFWACRKAERLEVLGRGARFREGNAARYFHDMLDATSKGEFGAGHGAEYYAGVATRGTEMVANFSALVGGKDGDIWRGIIHRLWPRFSEELEAAITKFGKVRK